MAKYNLNEALKKKSKEELHVKSDEIKLDDVSRVKVLSPGRQVMKRFLRNRLAVFGLAVLVFLFLFCFAGPLLYPYGQKEVFYKYDTINTKLGVATQNKSFTGYTVDSSIVVPTDTNSYMKTYIKEMQKDNLSSLLKIGNDGKMYEVNRLGDDVYTLSQRETKSIASFGESVVSIGEYDSILKSFTFKEGGEKYVSDALYKKLSTIKGTSGSFTLDEAEYSYKKTVGKRYDITVKANSFVYKDETLGEDFEVLAEEADDGQIFNYNGSDYVVTYSGKAREVFLLTSPSVARLFTTLAFNYYDDNVERDLGFRNTALLNMYSSPAFEYKGEKFSVSLEDGNAIIFDSTGKEMGEFSDFVVRRNDGQDNIPYDAKTDIIAGIEDLLDAKTDEIKINTILPRQTEDGRFEADENGNYILDDIEIKIRKTDSGFELWALQIKYVIDRYASPSLKHPLGCEGDGFDVLARIMYGGRVSLMVGFVVVFLEILLGVIMGGLAGYYGGWVDNLVMRIVDIFYCLPSMPIMIILGSMMDAMRLPVYPRLFIMMAALGIMGWAGVARLVRGQILSFREQEFMIAAESTGIKVKDRIFKHLIPNVMPQLIVSATMGMGGTILTESTLSFLGLGVKHPLSTWGTTINSVSTASAMAHYAYIWIPVGLLICFTVIAFNFVGDGLRDAFDPKGKR